MDWTEEYRPTTLDDLVGNKKPLKKLSNWAETWDEHEEAVILYGRPGVGKTTASHALANEHNWDVVELNASETRTQDVIDTVAGGAASMGTIHGGMGGKRLIILDEADNLHGNVDYGGAAAITTVVKEAKQPVILIANEFYEMSKTLRNRCQSIEFELVDTPPIARFLRDICDQEEIEYDQSALKEIARKSDGDVRGAVNDLQAIALANNHTVKEENVSTSTRDRTEELFPFLDVVLQEGSPKEAVESAHSLDEKPDDIIQWIEENVITAYNGEELKQAYEWLSQADTWLGRVQETQEYRYWRYATDAMTSGVASSRKNVHTGWTRWSMPTTWRKLGQTKATRNKRDDISRQIANYSGMSSATARTEVLPLLKQITHHCKPRDITVQMAAVYELDASDVAFITGSGEDTNKVSEIVKDAEEKRKQAINMPTGGKGERNESDKEEQLPFSESGFEEGENVESSSPVAETDDRQDDQSAENESDEESIQTTLF